MAKCFLRKPRFARHLSCPTLWTMKLVFFMFWKGKCTAISETETIEANPPDALLMKCGNFYNFCLPDENQPHYQAIAVHFHPEVLKKVYENELPSFLNESKPKNSKTFAQVEVSSLLTKYIESILFYFEHPELASEELLKLKVKEILLLLNESPKGEQVRELLSSLFVPTVVTIQEVVKAHLFDDISVSELAYLCHMSESTFKREFKKHYNDSPAHYIRIKKLEKAKELLGLGHKVSETAFQSGFNDLAHFSKLFKDYFGFPPSKMV